MYVTVAVDFICLPVGFVCCAVCMVDLWIGLSSMRLPESFLTSCWKSPIIEYLLSVTVLGIDLLNSACNF